MYNYSYIANEIINRVVERLAIQTEAIGFDDQASMVESLTAIQLSNVSAQTCFAQGAGSW